MEKLYNLLVIIFIFSTPFLVVQCWEKEDKFECQKRLNWINQGYDISQKELDQYCH